MLALRLRLVRGMKIYTKTGDKGTSGLYNGERRPKDDPVFQALGVVDELNGSIAMAYDFCDKQPEVQQWLEQISSCLFDVGASIATPQKTTKSGSKLAFTKFDSDSVEWLESKIDLMDTKMPAQTSFILPCGGGYASSQLQFARTIARKSERDVWPLIREDQVDPAVGKYLNRLSDFLFTTARFMAHSEGKTQKPYQKIRVKPKPEGDNN
ncbi:ATP:cob(I)alamin adenosyltransferase [Batrachochytrium salamandrivorans]|nr:ATP:cob(I)alamin adenosyltransferase [Batrachochytrium salamandrivorans]